MARFLLPRYQVLDNSANASSGAKLYFYSAGTSTPKDTFSDDALTVANTNPVVADSAGRFGDIFLESGDYKVVLTDSADVEVWTADPVTGAIGSSGAVDEKSADYTVTVGDATKLLNVDASGATRTQTLLAAATAGDGFEVSFKKSDSSANTVIIDGNGSETIDGATTLILRRQNDWVTLRCDGSNWLVVARGYGTVTQAVAEAGTDTTVWEFTPERVRQAIDANTVSVVAASRGLVAKYVTAATVDIDADAVVLKDTSGAPFLAESVNLTVDITASGANGLDTGSEASGTWYYLWVIYNGTTVAGLISASSTAPTMPSGYTFKALIGSVYNDGSSDFVEFWQNNRRVHQIPQVVFTAQTGVTSYTSQALTAFVPPIAKTTSGMLGITTDTAHAGKVAGNANGVGEQGRSAATGSINMDSMLNGGTFSDVPLVTGQTVYWKVDNTTANKRLTITGYTI